MITRSPLVLQQMPLASTVRVALVHARAAGVRVARAVAQYIDPLWLPVIATGLAVVMLLGGSPLYSDGFVATLILMAAVTTLVAAKSRTDAQRVGDRLIVIEGQQATALELCQRALACPDVREVLRQATTLIATRLDVEYCAVLESTPDDRNLLLRAGRGFPASNIGMPVLPRSDSDSAAVSGAWHQVQGVRSVLSVEIQAGDASYGLLDVYTTRERVFSADEMQFVQDIAQLLGAAIGRARADAVRQANEADLTYRAFHDPLTGLANRALFEDRLQQAVARVRREPAPIAVVYVDVDDFKSINDMLGHAVGDNVLVQIADRLSACLREGDTAARLGGDEFGVVLERATEAQAMQVAERIRWALRSIVIPGNDSRAVSASVGLGLSTECSTDVEQLVNQADSAMYRAKRAHCRNQRA